MLIGPPANQTADMGDSARAVQSGSVQCVRKIKLLRGRAFAA